MGAMNLSDPFGRIVVGNVLFDVDMSFSGNHTAAGAAYYGNQSDTGGSLNEYGRIIMTADKTEVVSSSSSSNGTFGAITNILWDSAAEGNGQEAAEGEASSVADAEYIFDRLDVRIIFIALYSTVFACCFFGKWLFGRLIV